MRQGTKKAPAEAPAPLAVIEPPAPVAAPPVEPAPILARASGAEPQPRTWRVNFRHRDTAGKPRLHPWLPIVLVIDGCRTEADVRAKLHELIDKAIFQIEPERAAGRA